MLKGIPALLSPALLKALCEMGHGDRMVIADGNFPAESVGRNAVVIRMDGHGAAEILDAVLKVFPLDSYVEKPAALMQKMPGDDTETPIWDEFRRVIGSCEPRAEKLDFIERFRFYEEAKKAFLIVATSESALYANIMLQKGVVTP